MARPDWARDWPERCAKGHPLEYPNVLVGWSRCDCGVDDGHRTLYCTACREMAAYIGCVDPTRVVQF